MKFEFDAEIKGMPNMDAAFIEFPFDVKETFGTAGQVKVRATFDGYEYRGSLAKMGHHCHFLIVTKAVRKAIGKQPGDTVRVVIEKDTEPRIVEIPPDFAEAMAAESSVKDFFDQLAYTHRKEYVQWITSAKKPETRQRRIQKALEMLRNKQKYS
jgi:hypothetical protein